ncbi:YncE family protein [Granulicella tundricola]|uniref:40-residue YVTN family beta-propeller repeat protein n=1 Tax=Granulicella tundricola (strain ATCC BAA-1859 / DSM 23138 / MP5ACTX9) TaxID=1198114 RepID=E8X220_GRATM|nr:YncE family protein [Granulicella tundricola]ADW70263.1 40-residue YVTN family beta-propeller repeat protein [Granulicella tundricola MP5ACTX9]
MRWKGLIAGLVMVGGMVPVMGAQESASGPMLLVLAKHDEMLSLVDPGTLKVVAKVPTGGNPHEVIASADGRTAWVTNYGNGSLHSIRVIDLMGRRVEKVIELGPIWGPHGLAFADGKVWFTAEREKLIGRIDPATEGVDWLMGTGQTGTHMLWVAKDASEIVTVNVGSGTMNLFTRNPVGTLQKAGGPPSKAGATTMHGDDPAPVPDWEQRIVKVGGLPEGFDVIPDAEGHAQTVWVANAKEGTVSVIDFATGQVTATIEAGVPTANRLKFTPDHRMALISREKSGELTFVDVASRKVLKRVMIGTGAAGVLVAPDGKRAYVSCSPDNDVVVVDLASMQVVGKIEAGMEPDGLAWAGR